MVEKEREERSCQRARLHSRRKGAYHLADNTFSDRRTINFFAPFHRLSLTRSSSIVHQGSRVGTRHTHDQRVAADTVEKTSDLH